MENSSKKTETQNFVGTTAVLNAINFNNSTLTTYFSTHNMYSTPVLLDAIVKNDCIELVYKRQYMVSLNGNMPNPEIYKDIYSRNGGDVRREIGTYIPPQEDSYQFDSDL
jgi:hypothetical protein